MTSRIPTARMVLMDPTRPDEVIDYVGWGGTTRQVVTDCELGRGVRRAPAYGLRRAVYDAAFGWVSGFRLRDIAYFILTRSLSERVRNWTLDRERAAWDADTTIHCPEPGCTSLLGAVGGRIEHHTDGSHTWSGWIGSTP